MLRLPPNDDVLPVLLAAAGRGPTLVVVPSPDRARLDAIRLRRAGLSVAVCPQEWAAAAAGVDVVIGSRVAAWAPCPDLAAVVVVDEHDEALQEERSPTWHARDVVVERARRLGVPVLLVSPCPTVVGLAAVGDRLTRPAIDDERTSWPLVEVVDRSRDEPWKTSLVSSPLIAHLRAGDRTVVCVHNIPGPGPHPGLPQLQVAGPLRALRGGRRAGRRRHAGVPSLRHGAAGRVPRVRRVVVRQPQAGRDPAARGAGGGGRAPGRGGDGQGRRARRPRPASTSARRRCCTGWPGPTSWRSSTSTSSCWPRATGPPSRRWRCSCGRPGSSVPGPAGDGCSCRRSCPATRSSRRRCTPTPVDWSSRSGPVVACSGCRRSLRWPPCRARAARPSPTSLRAVEGITVGGSDGSYTARAARWDDLGRALVAAPRPKGSRIRVAVDPPRALSDRFPQLLTQTTTNRSSGSTVGKRPWTRRRRRVGRGRDARRGGGSPWPTSGASSASPGRRASGAGSPSRGACGRRARPGRPASGGRATSSAARAAPACRCGSAGSTRSGRSGRRPARRPARRRRRWSTPLAVALAAHSARARSLTSTAHTVSAGDRRASVTAIGPAAAAEVEGHPRRRRRGRGAQQQCGAGVDPSVAEHARGRCAA